MQKKINKESRKNESKKEITRKNSKKVAQKNSEKAFKESDANNTIINTENIGNAVNELNAPDTENTGNLANVANIENLENAKNAENAANANNSFNTFNSNNFSFIDALKLVGLFKKEIRNFEKKCKNELNNHFLSQSTNHSENHYDMNCARSNIRDISNVSNVSNICHICDPNNLDNPRNLPYNQHIQANTCNRTRRNSPRNSRSNPPHNSGYNSPNHSYNQIQNSVFYRYDPFDVANSFLRPSQQIPKVDWSIWLLLTGRGFGKTFTGSNTVLQYVLSQKYKRICIISKTIEDVKKVMVEGESGIIATAEKYQDKINNTNDENGSDGHAECKDEWNENGGDYGNHGYGGNCLNDTHSKSEKSTDQKYTEQGDITTLSNSKTQRDITQKDTASLRNSAAQTSTKVQPNTKVQTNPIPIYKKSENKLVWNNGATATFYSADNIKKLRGPQFDFIWIDEAAKFTNPQEVFDQLSMCLRLGNDPKMIITTTPTPCEFLKNLIHKKEKFNLYITNGSTLENKDNLPKQYIQSILQSYENTEFGAQEIYGKIIQKQYILWDENTIQKCRLDSKKQQELDKLYKEKNENHRLNNSQIQQANQEAVQQVCSEILNLLQIEKVIVAIDPAVTEQGDETGIVVCGMSEQSRIYVLEDLSGNHNISQWCQIATNAYKNWNASKIVAEVNNGGDMIEKVLKSHASEIRYTAVRANKNKVARMNPVFMLYQQNKVRHAQIFLKLEHQMTHMEQYRSPDRIDAMVWCVTELYWNSSQGKVIVSIL